MLTIPKRIITVASNAELMNSHYYRRLWMAARNLKIPRRHWLDFIADTFIAEDIYIINQQGEPFVVPLVDDVFSNDLEMRWISYYLKPDDTDENPASRSRKLDRLRLIDLVFKIRYPNIASHFGR